MGKPFHVTLEDPTPVCSESARTSDQLRTVYLSPLDLQAPLYVYSLYFYKRNGSKWSSERVFDVLTEAMQKVLVLYYPAAGRLTHNSETQKAEIECNNRGVLLVKAITDARIEELGDSTTTDPELEKFVYKLRPTPENPLIAAQVTTCACGGFIIGFGCRHELFDGYSAMQFLSAWAAVARGIPLSELPTPFHSRELLKPELSLSQQAGSNLRQKFEGIALWKNPDENKSWEGTITDFSTLGVNPQCITKVFKLSKEMLDHLKQQAMESGEITKCSTFDVVTAHAWKVRVRALEMDPSEKLILRFAVDGRTRTEPPLPLCFIGNVYIMASHSCTVRDIVEGPLSSIVKRVQQAKADVSNSYIREAINALAATARTRALPSFRQTTVVSDWTKFPFHSLDFGWGEMSFVTHVALPLPDVIFLTGIGSKEKQELLLKLGLLPNIMEKFEQYLFQIQPQTHNN